MSYRIAIVGAGGVGGLVGGHLTRAGFDVTLIDAWPDHVSAMKDGGIVLTEPGSEYRVPVKAFHIGEVQSFHETPFDLAFVCVKLYDTDWATTLISPYLVPSGFIVTLQNGLIEDRIAAVVGWGRTVGCIAGGLYVGLTGPGHVVRARRPAHSPRNVFWVGELHGRVTPRVKSVAEMLCHVDGADVTTNLWGKRWSKLTANSMTSALCAVSGMNLRRLFHDPKGQEIMARLGGEAVAVGFSLGFTVEDIFGIAPYKWVDVGRGDKAAMEDVIVAFGKQAEDMEETAHSGMAQDLTKGRRTEIEYMNGYVAARATEAGMSAPTHDAIVSLIMKMKHGTTMTGGEAMDYLLNPVNGKMSAKC